MDVVLVDRTVGGVEIQRVCTRKMKESKNNTILNQYLREKRLYCYYELKIAKRGRFQFYNIEDSQDEGLPALQKEGMVWKWSDEDSRQKPCDGACLPPLPAYLVIKFDKIFYLILYSKITALKDSGIKGIGEEESRKLATMIVHTER